MRTLGILLVLVIGLAQAGRVHAQDTREEGGQIPPEIADEARRLLAEARAHHEARRYALAAEGYMAMYDVLHGAGVPRAAIALWNAGLALMEIPGRAPDARETFRRFLDESSTLTDDPQVRDWRSGAVDRIAELDVRIAAAQADEEPADPDHEAPADRGGGGTGAVSPVGPVVLAGGVIVLGVGGVFGALALTADSNLAAACGGLACTNTPEHRAAYDEMRTFGAVTDVMLVVGGLAAITGTILTFTLTEGGGAEATASVGLRSGGADFAIRGTF